MRITEYGINTAKIKNNISIACVSDLHGRKYEKVIAALKSIRIDAILLAGDILEVSNEYMRERNKNALGFLTEVSTLAPTYYCFGNHEIYFSHSRKYEERVPNGDIQKANIDTISSLGIKLVNDGFDSFTALNGDKILIGGLVCGYDMYREHKSKMPDMEFLQSYSQRENFKILLCHYPHYYDTYLKNTDFDLILSGHAHGGQWRIFGHGIYAPHQGLFPKYTSGIYDNRFIISRGAVNNSRPIPRFFNPTEILKINISPAK